MQEIIRDNRFWLIIGFTGQFLFSLRFIWQWLVSEKRGESVIPKAFWFFSIAGGVFLLSYSVYRRDPVFIIGQVLGLIVYFRNLRLIAKKESS